VPPQQKCRHQYCRLIVFIVFLFSMWCQRQFAVYRKVDNARWTRGIKNSATKEQPLPLVDSFYFSLDEMLPQQLTWR